MIPAPGPSLKVCVVVPAKDEEDLISRCLDSLARQDGVSPEEYEVLLVLDGCTDATGERARRTVSEHPDLRLSLLEGPNRGAGHARRKGMETACERLLTLGRPGGLIASTDADTIVAEDWLASQLTAAGCGARAIGGRIELLEEEGPPEEVRSWREKRGRKRGLKTTIIPYTGYGSPGWVRVLCRVVLTRGDGDAEIATLAKIVGMWAAAEAQVRATDPELVSSIQGSRIRRPSVMVRPNLKW